MHDQSEKWLKVLGLAPGASEQAVKDAYRDLVKVWHPDRFASDARLQQKAQEKLAELNTAFEHLKNYRPPNAGASTAARSGAASSEPPPFRATGAVEPSAAQGRPATTPERTRPASRPAPQPAAQPESPAAPTTGSLRVESQPSGARVVFDGQAVGSTPLIVNDVALGEHQIGLDLEARGYRPWSSSVIIAAGREEKLLAVMTPGATLNRPRAVFYSKRSATTGFTRDARCAGR